MLTEMTYYFCLDSGTVWNMTTTSIIIVVVICCILGTSLIWVVIIYHTRKRTSRYRGKAALKLKIILPILQENVNPP